MRKTGDIHIGTYLYSSTLLLLLFLNQEHVLVIDCFSPTTTTTTTTSFPNDVVTAGSCSRTATIQRKLYSRVSITPTTTITTSSSKTIGRQSRRCPISSTTTILKASSIVDEVTQEMKTAMKAKDTVTLNTIRLIRTAFANAAIDLKASTSTTTDTPMVLTDDDARMVLKKMAKMRKESIEMYEKAGAIDRAELERAELLIIERWLPESVDDDTVRGWVQEAIAQVVGSTGTTGTTPPPNMGKVMGAFMKSHKDDNVDGSVAQRIVKEEIAKLT